MPPDRTPDRRRWQFGIASLIVLQVLTAIVMSIYSTFGLVTIAAIVFFTIPVGMLILGVGLILNEFVLWLNNLGRWRFWLYVLLLAMILLSIRFVLLFSMK